MIKLISNPTIHENQVKVKAIGRIDLLPVKLQKSLNEVEQVTGKYNNHFLNIAVAYGGRKEIIDATKKIAKKAVKGIWELRDQYFSPWDWREIYN